MVPELLFTTAVAIDALQEPFFFVPLLIGGAVVASFEGWRHAALFTASGLIAWVLSESIKLYFAVPRPESTLIEITGYRFPSTHAFVGAALITSIFITGYVRTRQLIVRLSLALLSVAGIALIAWSRVYLNVHELIDVIAGTALGIGLAALLHLCMRSLRPTR